MPLAQVYFSVPISSSYLIFNYFLIIRSYFDKIFVLVIRIGRILFICHSEEQGDEESILSC